MGLGELALIAVRLSMDAFAVAVCKGLSMQGGTVRQGMIVGAYFGGFQALMPLMGFFLGLQFQGIVSSVDHWIAFVMLGIIGMNMIRSARHASCDVTSASLAPKAMLPLAVATSIDAMVMGMTFAFLHINIWTAIALIGSTTFLLSALGVVMGVGFGEKYKSRAELVGGVVLVLMGIKILLEHLGVLPG